MTLRYILLLAAVMATVIPVCPAAESARNGQAPDGLLEWNELPQLVPGSDEHAQVGPIGVFAGVHNGALILGGGRASLQGLSGSDSNVAWHAGDGVYILDRVGEPDCRWLPDVDHRLPRPVAFGAAVSTMSGMICIGGCDEQRCYADVFMLKWDSATAKLTVDPLPSLPQPLAFMAATIVRDVVYIAGGRQTPGPGPASNVFYSLDLAKTADKDAFVWQRRAACPGPARIGAALASQSDAVGDRLYLFGGSNADATGHDEQLSDAYSYDLNSGTWQELSPIPISASPPRGVSSMDAVASGANHLLLFRDGGRGGILAYHTITDTWTEVDNVPGPPSVGQSTTTTIASEADAVGADSVVLADRQDGPIRAVEWGSGCYVVLAGQGQPGADTIRLWRACPQPVSRFGWVNYVVLGTYLLTLVGMGIYFSRREKTTDDFFKAGGRVPWWAAGLSIFGTQLSAITFMAIPAKTYATNWLYFMLNMTIIVVAPFIILIFLPFYRRLNVTTAYEYLERRFNVLTRLIGSAMFIMLQFGRIGIVLFLPSIALSVVTGIDIQVCIIVMGVLSIIYTALGGIEAVIWTDVVQVVILLAGALLCLVLIVFDLDGGFAGMLDVAEQHGKLRTFDFDFDLARPTFWVVILGGLAANLISYGSDQAVIQRYLTTSNETAAARGIWTNGLLTLPASLLFFVIGTALFAYYKAHPLAMNPTMSNTDAVFPWYIVTELPVGIAGLLIAAIFAAAMSSLDSSMNSVATVVTTDFYRRFKPNVPDRRCLYVARWATVAVGLAGTTLALMMAGWNIKSLWDQLSIVIGLFAGGLGGLFLLGILTRRAHGVGAVIALAASGVVQFLVKEFTPAHFLLYSFTGVASCLIVGYLASLLIPISTKPIDGLTIYTLARNPARCKDATE